MVILLVSPVPLELSHFGLSYSGRWDGRKGGGSGSRERQEEGFLQKRCGEGQGVRVLTSGYWLGHERGSSSCGKGSRQSKGNVVGSSVCATCASYTYSFINWEMGFIYPSASFWDI